MQLISLCLAQFFLFVMPLYAQTTAPGPAFIPPDAPSATLQKNITLSRPEWAKNARLAVTLDQHLYPVLLPVIRAFEAQHRTTVAVRQGTCGISAGSLYKKEVDMAGFCCPPGKSDRLPGLSFHTIGISALAILVNRANPVNDLSVNRIRRFFSGADRTWEPGRKSLRKLPVLAVARLHCKTRPGHWRLLLDNEEMFGPRTREVGTIRDMLESVAGFRGAIGYEVLDNLARYPAGRSVKFVRVGGVAPDDPVALAAHRYPFYRVYNITTWSPSHANQKLSRSLARFLIRNLPPFGNGHHIVPSSMLKKSGWRFMDDELVGPPPAPGRRQQGH